MKIVGKSLLAAALTVAVSLTAQAEGDAAKGAKVFRKCKACHTFDDKRKIGPTLSGVIGRKAGAVEGFRYSKAFKGLDLVWDEANLSAFLKAPKKFVKGTKMAFPGLRKPQEITDLLAYMAENGQ